MSDRGARRALIAAVAVIVVAFPVASAGAAAHTPTGPAGAAHTVTLAPPETPEGMTSGSILFVGNSFTQGFEDPAMSYNRDAITDANGSGVGGVAGIFARLTDAEGMRFDVTVEAVGGQTLGWHAANKPSVLAGTWDAVVAQELSTLPLPGARGGDPAAFRADVAAVSTLVHSTSPDAALYLYETWASPTGARLQGYADSVDGVARMQSDLRAAYAVVGRESDAAAVVPVGDAFGRGVRQGVVDATPADGTAPGTVSLWSAADARHANVFGSYLAAVVLYATITHRDPRLLATGPGSAAADLGIPVSTAHSLHRLAFEVAGMPDGRDRSRAADMLAG